MTCDTSFTGAVNLGLNERAGDGIMRTAWQSVWSSFNSQGGICETRGPRGSLCGGHGNGLDVSRGATGAIAKFQRAETSTEPDVRRGPSRASGCRARSSGQNAAVHPCGLRRRGTTGRVVALTVAAAVHRAIGPKGPLAQPGAASKGHQRAGPGSRRTQCLVESRRRRTRSCATSRRNPYRLGPAGLPKPRCKSSIRITHARTWFPVLTTREQLGGTTR